jgi:hypothetical protein
MTSRRKFLKGSLTVISAGAFLRPRIGYAQNLQPIDPTSPKAVGFGYAEDTEKVDNVKFPRHQVSQSCSNCQLYLQGGISVDGKEGLWGKCALFPEGLVAEKGWCNSWVAKQG